jgi:hypothetical protein
VTLTLRRFGVRSRAMTMIDTKALRRRRRATRAAEAFDRV